MFQLLYSQFPDYQCRNSQRIKILDLSLFNLRGFSISLISISYFSLCKFSNMQILKFSHSQLPDSQFQISQISIYRFSISNFSRQPDYSMCHLSQFSFLNVIKFVMFPSSLFPISQISFCIFQTIHILKNSISQLSFSIPQVNRISYSQVTKLLNGLTSTNIWFGRKLWQPGGNWF